MMVSRQWHNYSSVSSLFVCCLFDWLVCLFAFHYHSRTANTSVLVRLSACVSRSFCTSTSTADSQVDEGDLRWSTWWKQIRRANVKGTAGFLKYKLWWIMRVAYDWFGRNWETSDLDDAAIWFYSSGMFWGRFMLHISACLVVQIWGKQRRSATPSWWYALDGRTT